MQSFLHTGITQQLMYWAVGKLFHICVFCQFAFNAIRVSLNPAIVINSNGSEKHLSNGLLKVFKLYKSCKERMQSVGINTTKESKFGSIHFANIYILLKSLPML